MKYQNGKIYRLINNEMPDLVYYGSTCTELRKRLWGHKCHAKKSNNSSKILFEFGKVEIILVEKYPCSDKSELLARERFYIENNICINKEIPGRTAKEYYNDNKEKYKEYYKEYRDDNKEKMNEYYKEYRDDNKEKIKKYKKEYYEDNKEKLLKQRKEYYHINREKIKEKMNEKVECECGGIFTKQNKSKHFRTKKHIDYFS